MLELARRARLLRREAASGLAFAWHAGVAMRRALARGYSPLELLPDFLRLTWAIARVHARFARAAFRWNLPRPPGPR